MDALASIEHAAPSLLPLQPESCRALMNLLLVMPFWPSVIVGGRFLSESRSVFNRHLFPKVASFQFRGTPDLSSPADPHHVHGLQPAVRGSRCAPSQ